MHPGSRKKGKQKKYQGGNSAGELVKGVTFHTGKEGTSCVAICNYPNQKWLCYDEVPTESEGSTTRGT